MKDNEIMQHIEKLVNEEHELRKLSEEGGLDDEQQVRIQVLQVHLDQLWDLLRQRRAKREFGLNPDDAKERDASTVEHYQQ